MLTLNQVTKKFKNKTVLKGIDLSLQSGVYGLLGPNGAGKTTLMRCILGIYKCDGGSIDMQGSAGYLPQKFGLYKELTVRDMLTYFATLKEIKEEDIPAEIERVLAVVNLSDRIGDRVGTLSGGMIRRLGIAQTLLGDAGILIFDEPTAGLDPEERMRFKNIVAALPKDKLVIISTHIVEDVEAVCDHIVIMDGGVIKSSATGKDTALLAKDKVYLAPAGTPLPKGAFIERQVQTESGENAMRVLSDTPIEGAQALSPTIEDGYMCMIKNIGGEA